MKTTFLGLLIGMIASTAAADSFWDHNGSLMRLVAQGSDRWISYEAPRQGMIDQGVVSGTLFFNGRRVGNSYTGTARVFSRNCPDPMTFPIGGTVLNEQTIVLEGLRPVFSNCRPTGQMKNERLVFTYVAAQPQQQPPAPPPPPVAVLPRSTVLDMIRETMLILQQVYPYLYMQGRPAPEFYIRSVTFEAANSACAAPGTWIASVVIPPVPGFQDMTLSGDLAFDDVTRQFTCATLPMD